eukprot:TRINITY_DN16667_c0_g1_i1.p1 TRINITY_DN16667_c0_g1~~TRINITY_DN16667_c0_g1_i1.p1  ORF type:complete len:296 (+),score=43.58 TRINITY_DN16667_c0_g1_i1:49-936(+)
MTDNTDINTQQIKKSMSSPNILQTKNYQGVVPSNNQFYNNSVQLQNLEKIIEQYINSYFSEQEIINLLINYNYPQPLINVAFKNVKERRPDFFSCFDLMIRLRKQIQIFNEITKQYGTPLHQRASAAAYSQYQNYNPNLTTTINNTNRYNQNNTNSINYNQIYHKNINMNTQNQYIDRNRINYNNQNFINYQFNNNNTKLKSNDTTNSSTNINISQQEGHEKKDINIKKDNVNVDLKNEIKEEKMEPCCSSDSQQNIYHVAHQNNRANLNVKQEIINDHVQQNGLNEKKDENNSL